MNLFVARLNYATTENGLIEAFEEFGEVSSAKVIMDRDTGKSKGFGFVEMPNDNEALEAIRGLNDADLEGRTIVVKEARENGGSRNIGGNRENRY